jgi:hypothetical protein
MQDDKMLNLKLMKLSSSLLALGREIQFVYGLLIKLPKIAEAKDSLTHFEAVLWDFYSRVER